MNLEHRRYFIFILGYTKIPWKAYDHASPSYSRKSNIATTKIIIMLTQLHYAKPIFLRKLTIMKFQAIQGRVRLLNQATNKVVWSN